MSKRGLGRGLDALFRDETADVASDESVVVNLPLSQIDPSDDQPRKRFEPEALKELAESIASVGLLQPILVRRNDARYVIIAGERRWRAARLAGLSEIPALVRDADKLMRMQMALIENLQRADLNAVEEAAAVQALIEECGLTQEDVASRIGKSRPAVANLVRLLDLPDEILEMLRNQLLTPGHARSLVAVPSLDMQLKLANEVINRALSVRELEELIREEKKPKKAKRANDLPPELQTFADIARRALGAKVSVRGTLKRGQLIVQYANPAELQRLYDAMSTLSPDDDDTM